MPNAFVWKFNLTLVIKNVDMTATYRYRAIDIFNLLLLMSLSLALASKLIAIVYLSVV